MIEDIPSPLEFVPKRRPSEIEELQSAPFAVPQKTFDQEQAWRELCKGLVVAPFDGVVPDPVAHSDTGRQQPVGEPEFMKAK